MVTKDMFDIIFKAEGGKYDSINLDRVKFDYDFVHEKILTDYLADNGFDDLSGHLEANNSDYANQGYKIGFKDGIRFLVSILCD